jgi:nucleotide-binding universal stress UspA family protein
MSTSILIKKILVPIDGSDLSFKAASYALHLAKMENAELTALNVVEDIKQGGFNRFAGKIWEFIDCGCIP